MPSKAELICVDPAQVRHFWPWVQEYLFSAVRATNISHTQSIADAVLSGRSLLWIAWDGEKIKGAGSTELMATEQDKFCVITSWGGEDMPEWVHLVRRVEDYAKAEGCRAVRVFGRGGWLRALDGYRKTAIVIEKELA